MAVHNQSNKHCLGVCAVGGLGVECKNVFCIKHDGQGCELKHIAKMLIENCSKRKMYEEHLKRMAEINEAGNR
jgi:hypothetical protein